MKRYRIGKLVATLVLLALLPTLTFAQDTTKTRKPVRKRAGTTDITFQNTNADVSADDIGNSALYFNKKYKGTLGTPYFLPDWHKGEFLMDGKLMPNATLKYNVRQQELMMLRPWSGNDSIVLNPAQVTQFRLMMDNNTTFTFQRIGDAYYQVLADGRAKLYKKLMKSFRRPDNVGHLSLNDRYDQYKDESAYYVMRPDGQLERVKLTTRAVLKTLNVADDVKQKLTAEGLRADNEPNAVKLFQALNRL